jgi:hypothetical protein
MTAIEDFNTRLLLSVHGIPVPALEEGDDDSILAIVRDLVREELRVLLKFGGDAPTFDEAAEELRALRKMVLRRISAQPPLEALVRSQEERLHAIEQIKRVRGLKPSARFDVSRSTSVHWESAQMCTPGAGIEVRELWNDNGRRALRVTMPAGAKWPFVDHHVPGPEEVFVVSGDMDEFTEGMFIHYPAGSSHVPSTRAGCTLFVFYPEG